MPPSSPCDAAASSSVQSAVGLLRVALLVATGGLVVCLGLAAVLVVADERSHTDYWDGLGTWIGLVIGGATLVVGLVVGMLLLSLRLGVRRWRRSGAGGVLVATGVVSVVVAAPIGLYAAALARETWLLALVAAAPALVVVGGSVLVLSVLRPGPALDPVVNDR